MTNSIHDFDKIAARPAPNKPTPFSLRLTFDERARLERDAAGISLDAHIRGKLLGDDVAPRKTRGTFPVMEQEALGRVIGALGSSCLSAKLIQIAKAVNTGSLPVMPETEEDLRVASAAMQMMRAEPMLALGRTRLSEP